MATAADAAANAEADSEDGTAFHAHAFVVRAFSRSSFIGIDSMANRHIFNDLDMFLPQTLKVLPTSRPVAGLTGELLCTHSGSVCLGSFTLHDVLYSPKAPLHLLSVGALRGQFRE